MVCTFYTFCLNDMSADSCNFHFILLPLAFSLAKGNQKKEKSGCFKLPRMNAFTRFRRSAESWCGRCSLPAAHWNDLSLTSPLGPLKSKWHFQDRRRSLQDDELCLSLVHVSPCPRSLSQAVCNNSNRVYYVLPEIGPVDRTSQQGFHPFRDRSGR